MAMTDPISDMLTRIRNAGLAKHQKMEMPASKMKLALAEVLKEQGYIKNFKFINEGVQGVLRIYLKFDNENIHVIHEIKRESKPGRRLYVNAGEIPKVKNGLGCAIVSTSQGVMSDVAAREAKIGGELVCTVW
ncbi:MAG: 30S ribosomal protein S8 [Desulfuromonas sp.]|nr:30S ribosomal protein S8 [Desulfuromonas sp.]